MTTICLLGDSHVAAMEKGWEKISVEFPDVRMSFYAAPAKTLCGLVVADGRLVAGSDALKGYLRRSRQPDAVVEGGFDMYLVCGLGLRIGQAPHAVRSFLAAAQTVPAAQAREELFAGLCEAMRKTAAAETLAKLREISKVPIGLVPAPMRGRPNIEGPLAKAHELGHDKVIAEVFAEACDVMARDRGAVFFRQPEKTLGVTPLSTKTRYTVSPASFFIYDSPEDQKHMNAAYGAIVTRRAVKTMLVANRPSARRQAENRTG